MMTFKVARPLVPFTLTRATELAKLAWSGWEVVRVEVGGKRGAILRDLSSGRIADTTGVVPQLPVK